MYYDNCYELGAFEFLKPAAEAIQEILNNLSLELIKLPELVHQIQNKERKNKSLKRHQKGN